MTSRRRGVTGEAEEVTGVVGRLVVAEGSKSERAALGLSEAEGGFVVVHVVGDNPFEEGRLASRLGERLTLVGRWRNGVLRVEASSLPPLAAHGTTEGPEAGSGSNEEAEG